MAYIITDRKFNEEELSERGYWEDWNTYKGEWAKLMLFMEETEQRHRNLYERVGEQEMPVTLRTNSRKQEPQTIPNTNNWLFRLIRKELAGRGKSREKNNPKGWIINSLKGKIKES